MRSALPLRSGMLPHPLTGSWSSGPDLVAALLPPMSISMGLSGVQATGPHSPGGHSPLGPGAQSEDHGRPWPPPPGSLATPKQSCPGPPHHWPCPPVTACQTHRPRGPSSPPPPSLVIPLWGLLDTLSPSVPSPMLLCAHHRLFWFQSSPGSKAGCFSKRGNQRGGGIEFQSSPGSKAGCFGTIRPRTCNHFGFNPHPALKPGASPAFLGRIFKGY